MEARAALDLAFERFKTLMTEDTSAVPWKVVDSKNPDVKLWEKNYDIPRDPPPKPSTPSLRVAKAVVTVKAPLQAILEVAASLDCQKQWDGPSIDSKSSIVDNMGDVQIAYILMKTLAASTAKRDLCVARAIQNDGSGKAVFMQTSCVHTKVPVDSQLVRAHHVIFGIQIEQVNAEDCTLTLVNCLDLTGWIHDKFVDADVVKCAQRVVKIRQIAVSRK